MPRTPRAARPSGRTSSSSKTHGLAAVAEQHHVVLAIGQGGADEVVAFVQVHRDDAALARVVELIQRRLLDRTHAGAHEHEMIRREAAELTCQR
jgi:hypothetical protein